jgi:AbrB family looped-hinge helix DNA binding protein
MASAEVTSKGQITIPVELRTELNLKPGDPIFFARDPDGRYVLFPKNGSIQRLKGMFGKFPRVVSLEEMDDAIARGAAGLPEPEDEAQTA